MINWQSDVALRAGSNLTALSHTTSVRHRS